MLGFYGDIRFRYTNMAANGENIGQIEMLGVFVAAEKHLEVRYLVDLGSQPFENLFLGELLAHHNIGPVMANIDLGKVTR